MAWEDNAEYFFGIILCGGVIPANINPQQHIMPNMAKKVYQYKISSMLSLLHWLLWLSWGQASASYGLNILFSAKNAVVLVVGFCKFKPWSGHIKTGENKECSYIQFSDWDKRWHGQAFHVIISNLGVIKTNFMHHSKYKRKGKKINIWGQVPSTVYPQGATCTVRCSDHKKNQ